MVNEGRMLRRLSTVRDSRTAAPGARLQRLVDDLGSTLLEVIEAPGPLDAVVTGVTIFDPHDDLVVSPGELVPGVGIAAGAELPGLVRRLGQLRAAGLVVKAPGEVSGRLRDEVRRDGVPVRARWWMLR